MKKGELSFAFRMLAEWTGLEPATPGVTGRYSNQLNYHSAVFKQVLHYSMDLKQVASGRRQVQRLQRQSDHARRTTLVALHLTFRQHGCDGQAGFGPLRHGGDRV